MRTNSITTIRKGRLAPLMCLVALVTAAPAAAQTDVGPADAGPTAVAPVLSRDADGRYIIRATRVTQPIQIDGRLDDAAYREVPAITGFIQQEPNTGAPGTQSTEAWVLFDADYIYVACRCGDERPEGIVANDMRRDSVNIQEHDHFAVAFDTFHDGRNGYLMYVSAAGGMRDGAIADERPVMTWDGVWDGKVSRFEGGWIAEMAIPFKSLRYPAGRDQTWGINLRRLMRGRYERVFIVPLSPAGGNSAINFLSQAATLVGLQAPPTALNLEVKPYAASRVTTDRVSRPPVDQDLDPDAGLDVKYGLTKSLTLDFTFNTDFAQVEVDEAQVNLTRFNLSFPEKREFFLEGQGIFSFGGGGGGDAPTIFYSRRIGLSGSREVPVVAGGRLTGKAGPWTIGAFNIETGENETAGAVPTNFTVLRLRRDLLRRSAVGAIYSRRSVSTVAPGGNDLWGIDANLAFYENVQLSGYLAQSRTEGRDGNDLNYRTQVNYTADRYGLSLDRLVVEENFNPEVGLLRRENFRRNFAQGRFSPRTRNNPVVRKWTSQVGLEYVTDNQNRLESRELTGSFDTEFHNSDNINVAYSRIFEVIPTPFEISPGVRIPVGGYTFDNVRMGYSAGQQHRLSGSGSLTLGSFYDGHRKTASFSGRLELTPQFGVEPNLSLNWIDLPQGAFTTTIVGGRATYTMTPRMFVAALVQYASSSTSLLTNLRFRWEYRPGSEFFVVYTEGRSTFPLDRTELESRGFVVKVNRLLRF